MRGQSTYHHSIETGTGEAGGALQVGSGSELIFEILLGLGGTGGEGAAVVEAFDLGGSGRGEGQDAGGCGAHGERC